MRRAIVVPLLLGLVLAACGGSTPPGQSATGSGASGAPMASPNDGSGLATGQPQSAAPSASAEVVPTTEPSSGPVATASGAPVESAVPVPSGSASLPATPCQPEGDNPAFWPGLAGAVSWDVYCAVLPRGWFIASGSYRLANGGKLEISYRGPDGASLALSEGSFCTDSGGCVPGGSDIGDAAFGQKAGTLVAVDAGGYAIVVARGQTPSWLMVTTGLDQATSVSLGAALMRVGG